MAFPTLGSAGTIPNGFIAQGVATTAIWGTSDSVTNTGWNGYTVTRIRQMPDVESEPLSNGLGVKAGRMMWFHGMKFEITVRDDINMTPPTPGTTLTIKDGMGMLNANRTQTYTCRVIDSQWEVAPKQAAERTITCEYLTALSTNN